MQEGQTMKKNAWMNRNWVNEPIRQVQKVMFTKYWASWIADIERWTKKRKRRLQDRMWWWWCWLWCWWSESDNKEDKEEEEAGKIKPEAATDGMKDGMDGRVFETRIAGDRENSKEWSMTECNTKKIQKQENGFYLSDRNGDEKLMITMDLKSKRTKKDDDSAEDEDQGANGC